MVKGGELWGFICFLDYFGVQLFIYSEPLGHDLFFLMLSNLRLLAPGWLVAELALVTPQLPGCRATHSQWISGFSDHLIPGQSTALLQGGSFCSNREPWLILTPLRWGEESPGQQDWEQSHFSPELNMWECHLDLQNCKVLPIMFPTI